VRVVPAACGTTGLAGTTAIASGIGEFTTTAWGTVADAGGGEAGDRAGREVATAATPPTVTRPRRAAPMTGFIGLPPTMNKRPQNE
jgi:hypothetical protein